MTPLERGRRRAEARQRIAREVFAKDLTSKIDVERLILQKLHERTKGSSSEILRQFRKMDSTVVGQTSISIAQFKRCLVSFGLEGLRDEDIRQLFKKYDVDNSVTFGEFANRVAQSFSKQSGFGTSSSDLLDAKRARDRARILKRQAIRTRWQTVSVDAERLLQEKIEQRIKGGPHSLRLAFKKFSNGSSGEITKVQFRSTLEKVGLEGLSDSDVDALFSKFDHDHNSKIDFNEFVSFVLKSNARQNSLAVDFAQGEQRTRQLKERALSNQKKQSKLHWNFVKENESLDGMLKDKILTKLSGGPHVLRRAFNLFDQSRGDGAIITCEMLHEALERLGFVDIPFPMVKKLFRKVDQSGDGEISFAEFTRFIENQRPTKCSCCSRGRGNCYLSE